MEIITPFLPFVADILLKGAFLLAGGFVLTGLLRKASAKWRHLVWSVVLLGLAVVTFYVAIKPIPSPKIKYTFMLEAPLPEQAPHLFDTQNRYGISAPSLKELQEERLLNDKGGENDDEKTMTVNAFIPSPVLGKMEYGLLFIWFTGAVGLLFGMLRQAVLLRRLKREAHLVTSPELLELAHLLKVQLKIRRSVMFLHHPIVLSPMTWGAFRPVVMIPTAWLDEGDDSHEMMLLHELSHVRRWDYPIHQLAQVLSALHWPTPLIWLARRQMLTERERACDDVVLQNGVRPSDYAGKLVALARNMLGGKVAHAGLGMAHVSELKTRVNAILHESEERLVRLQWGGVLAMMGLLTLVYAEFPLRLNGVTYYQMTLLEWSGGYRALHGGLVSNGDEIDANAPFEERIVGPEVAVEMPQREVKTPFQGETELSLRLEKLETEKDTYLENYELLKTKIRAFVNPAIYPNKARLRLNHLRAQLYGLEPENQELENLFSALKKTLETGKPLAGNNKIGFEAKINSLFSMVHKQDSRLSVIEAVYDPLIKHEYHYKIFATKEAMEATTTQLSQNRPHKNTRYRLITRDQRWENNLYVGPYTAHDPVIIKTLHTP
ncbi:MAG: M56 family metallopeptidase [Bacteroidetes Order II. Incertae sedis bacterium]|nr:M56 family metallopeptidase [Bacteroidetes Order II. bacterium]